MTAREPSAVEVIAEALCRDETGCSLSELTLAAREPYLRGAKAAVAALKASSARGGRCSRERAAV